MHAHLWDLRVERPDLSPAAFDGLARQLAQDWRQAELSPRERALCAYAERLTLTPGDMGPQDIAALRQVGLSEAGIHRVVQVVAYFNYINRIADGLDVALEPEMEPRP
jgi:uncharacterized peroxidase-related enzyme